MIHATGRPRKQGGGYLLCNRKKWGWTTTAYATCKRCARSLRKRGYRYTPRGWIYAP